MILKFPPIDLTRPPDRPAPNPGGGKVLRVAFGELGRLEQKREQLYEWPAPEDHELGHVTIHADGEAFWILELCRGPGGEPGWVVRGRYRQAEMQTYLVSVRATANRLDRMIAQRRCAHDFDKRRKCVHCGTVKPPKYRLCRRRPGSWVNEASRYDATPICRRRQGHDGDCSWASDPGSRRDASW